MSDDKKAARPTLKPTKIRTDGRGRSVWADPVATAKFELVSTQELRVILESDDEQSVRSIEDAATTTDDGVLARNAETGMFEIIDDTDLRALLDKDFGLPKHTRPADVTLEPVDAGDDEESLSLVSTQALRKIIGADTADDDDLPEELDAGGGFDPYNTG